MSMTYNDIEYYAVGDKERLRATTVEEAVKEFVNDTADLPETVKVQGYSRVILKEDDPCFRYTLEGLIGSLDENYAEVDGSGYTPSDKTLAKFNEFKELLIAEYPVWYCVPKGAPVVINLGWYLND